MEKSLDRTALFVIGPVDQDYVGAAWRGFRGLLSRVLDREIVWLVGTLRNWSVKSVYDRTGDPAGWRILAPKLNPGLKTVGLAVRPVDCGGPVGYSVHVQKWKLQFLAVEIRDLPTLPIPLRFEVLDALRRGLPLTGDHIWYLFSGMALGINNDGEPVPNLIHSFGYGGDDANEYTSDGTADFEARFLSSLDWRIR